MAKHTRKAVSTLNTTPRSGHSRKAQGRRQTPGATTKHTKKAQGFEYDTQGEQGSKGGGTSAATRQILGTPGRRYQRRNTSGRPMTR